MPLDTLMYKSISQKEFCRRAQWRLKFALFPKKCFFTEKPIWLSYAYQGTAVWTGPGEPVYEQKWLTKEEFIIMKLRGINA